MGNSGEFVVRDDGSFWASSIHGQYDYDTGTPNPFHVFNADGKTLHCAYTVTFTDLAGDFAQFNGDNVVRFYRDDSYGTFWRNQGTRPQILLIWDKQNVAWQVRALASASCDKYWIGGADPCDPIAAPYSDYLCGDDGCADEYSCENSEGAIVYITHGVPQ